MDNDMTIRDMGCCY